jgi:hypothetical protein
MNTGQSGRRMRRVSILLVLAFLAGCAQPQAEAPEPIADFDDLDLAATATTGVIRGIVVDEAIRPVANASVTLTPGDRKATSSLGGTFGFEGLEPGTYFLKVERLGYNGTQTSAEVVAGVAEPAITKILLVANPGTSPYFEVLVTEGFMTCGFAVFVTSAGCDTSTAELFGDKVYFPFEFDTLPQWTQGELIWEHTQAAGGAFIWQIAKPGTNDYYSAGETTTSPALAFIDTETLEDNREDILDTGVEYRIFGGPHPTCTVDTPYTPYGCGATLNQRVSIYIHSFYNFVPLPEWRFSADGDPIVPPV